MKWTRGLHHLRNLAGECARTADMPPTIRPLRVTRLWAYGPFVDEQADLETITIALAADLPAEDVPWLSTPRGANHWTMAAKLRAPLSAVWRSMHAPIWNHVVVRPVLLWSAEEGLVEAAFDALEEDKVDALRDPAPSPDQLSARIDEELDVSLRATRDRVDVYGRKRWTPSKLEPYADDLWAVTNGYLDLLDAKGPR